ncbi:MAG: AsmA family protein [Phycisphaerae bacterium]|nr:AsmA family protein [Phycisphaerae bacterium]
MKKKPKIVRVVLLAVLILIVAVVITVDIFAEYAIKIAIETAATKTLNVGVSVGDIDLSIMAGRLGISNLSINNPAGYQYKKMLELKEGSVSVDIKSLLSDVVKIRELKLDGVNVVLEQRGISNNINDVIKAIPAKEGKASEPSGKKLHIDKLEILNVTVEAKLLPIPGKTDTITLKLDPIVMTDLGSDNKLDTAKLSSKILLAIAAGVADKGTGVLPEEMTSAMKSTLGMTTKLGKEGKRLFKEGKEGGTELMKNLKGLLNKPEEEK